MIKKDTIQKSLFISPIISIILVVISRLIFDINIDIGLAFCVILVQDTIMYATTIICSWRDEDETT